MSGGDEAPVTQAMVGRIVAAVSLALTLGAFAWNLRADADRLRADMETLERDTLRRTDLVPLQGEVAAVRAMLCNQPENRDRYECRKDGR